MVGPAAQPPGLTAWSNMGYDHLVELEGFDHLVKSEGLTRGLTVLVEHENMATSSKTRV